MGQTEKEPGVLYIFLTTEQVLCQQNMETDRLPQLLREGKPTI